jgi:quercetin dioxygenase-like cupin family protein
MTMGASGLANGAGWLAAAVSLTACLVGDAASAPPAAVTTLLQRELTDLRGKEALVLTVEYPPGGASLPHRHDADVLVYVLEGEVIMQLAGRPPQTLGPGAIFFEGPEDVHVRSANASTSAPAKLLVFMVKDKDRPVSRAVAAPADGDRQ